ncbi:hypothetical protein PVAND_008401 [Polypedilum vanderplanki]|uniref:Uncharacterized protein n=1 Tax=Polypedilum vanderplanki TaxID=319348 RepID=A0A9J6CA35_POLVA|nr:hypothetical protein PVAND_008401 [Polypedilum vanderplanki]
MNSNYNLNELSEIQTKTIIDRVNETEKFMSLLLESIASLNRKNSRSRDRVDELSKVIKTLADSDNQNESISAAMDEFSKAIVHLADIEDMKILRIENKIIGELIQQYEFFCRNTREDVKNLVAARDREINKRRNIEVNRRSRGAYAENEIMISNIQLSKVLKEIFFVAENFEKQKLNDMKEILTNFILIYLKYFASGLEIFSAAYEIISSIDEKADLEHYTDEIKKINRQFKKHLESENNTSNKFKFMKAFSMFSHSTSNLDRIGKSVSSKSSMGKKSQSTTSLNSIDSNESEVVKAEKESIEADTKTSTDDDTDIDEDDSTMVTDGTITEETNQQKQTPKSNVKNTK